MERKKGRIQPANVRGGRKLREAKQFFLKTQNPESHLTAKYNPFLFEAWNLLENLGRVIQKLAMLVLLCIQVSNQN